MLFMIIVLLTDMVLGVYINMLFNHDLTELEYHRGIIETMAINSEFYLQNKFQMANGNENDLYYQHLTGAMSMLGEGFQNKFHKFCRKLRESMLWTIESLKMELLYEPHTVLNIRTDIRLLVALGTITSALGVSAINKFVQFVHNAINRDSTIIEPDIDVAKLNLDY